VISSSALGTLRSSGDVHDVLARAALAEFQRRLLEGLMALDAGKRDAAVRAAYRAGYSLGKAVSHVESTPRGPSRSALDGRVRVGAEQANNLLTRALSGASGRA
jgi:hypothetical protein